jgi:type I restriction enzyme R subunit
MEFVLPIKNFLKTYITDPIVRDVIDSGKYADLATSPVRDDFKALNNEWRSLIPNYVKDYINLNQYA